ncbi:MAG: hypothetical protein IKC03_01710 [Oscillospiraceae bacterium]|nr:hypothetical protein [Oscillospiraceae bacterium]
MKQEHLTAIFVLAKRMGNLFDEVTEISRQLADALDRQDELSMEMILAMRSEPIEKLLITDEALREHLESIEELGDRERVRALLNGDGSVSCSDMEAALSQQAALNGRLHQKLLELDKIISYKIGRDKSIYR